MLQLKKFFRFLISFFHRHPPSVYEQAQEVIEALASRRHETIISMDWDVKGGEDSSFEVVVTYSDTPLEKRGSRFKVTTCGGKVMHVTEKRFSVIYGDGESLSFSSQGYTIVY